MPTKLPVHGIRGIFKKGTKYEAHSLITGASPAKILREGIATHRYPEGRLRSTSVALDTSSDIKASKGLRRPGGLQTSTKHSVIIEVGKGGISDVSKPFDWKGKRYTRSGKGVKMNERIDPKKIVGYYDRDKDLIFRNKRLKAGMSARIRKKLRVPGGGIRQKFTDLGARLSGQKILE